MNTLISKPSTWTSLDVHIHKSNIRRLKQSDKVKKMPQKQKKDAINANLVEKDRAGKRILYRHVVHRRLALRWKDDKMQANQWKFDSP